MDGNFIFQTPTKDINTFQETIFICDTKFLERSEKMLVEQSRPEVIYPAVLRRNLDPGFALGFIPVIIMFF